MSDAWMKLLEVDTDWDGWKPRHAFEAGVNRAVTSLPFTLAALVEAHGQEAVLRALGGECFYHGHTSNDWRFIRPRGGIAVSVFDLYCMMPMPHREHPRSHRCDCTCRREPRHKGRCKCAAQLKEETDE